MRCLPAWLSISRLSGYSTKCTKAGTKCEHEYECAYECPRRVPIDHRAYRILCALRLCSWPRHGHVVGWQDAVQPQLSLSLSPSPLLSFSHTGNVRVQLARCLIALRHVSWHPQLVACNLRAVAKAQVGPGEGGGGRVIWWCSKHLYSRAPTRLQGNLLTYKGASCHCRRLFTVSLDLACHMARLPRGAAANTRDSPGCTPSLNPLQLWQNNSNAARCKM